MKLGVQVGLGPGHIVLDGDPGAPPTKGHSPQFSVHICCVQMAGWIKMPVDLEIGFDPSDIVLDGDLAPPSPKRGQGPSVFGPCLLWPTTAWIKMPLGMEVGFSLGYIVLDGHPAPPHEKRGTAFPQFSANVSCAQMAGWMKMPLGMKVSIDPSDILLDGDPASLPKKRAAPPNLRPMSIVSKRLHRSRCHFVWR